MRGKGSGFTLSLTVPSLFWEVGKLIQRLTSVSRCVRREERDGQRRWLYRVLQQFLQKAVNSSLLKIGTFSLLLSFLILDVRTGCFLFFVFLCPYVSCDYPNASKAGIVFMEMQDKLVYSSFTTASCMCMYVYVNVPMHAEIHCVFNITDQAKRHP